MWTPASLASQPAGTAPHGRLADSTSSAPSPVSNQASRLPAWTAPLGASGSFDLIARLGQSPADLRVVVETTVLDITSGRPAIDHVRAGIAAGCHVVTANKGPAAFAFADLRDAAEARGVSFLFEGAVMDGIPIFNLVRETLPVVEVARIPGRRERHDQSHSVGTRGRRRVRSCARAHAASRDRGGGSVARR